MLRHEMRQDDDKETEKNEQIIKKMKETLQEIIISVLVKHRNITKQTARMPTFQRRHCIT